MIFFFLNNFPLTLGKVRREEGRCHLEEFSKLTSSERWREELQLSEKGVICKKEEDHG